MSDGYWQRLRAAGGNRANLSPEDQRRYDDIDAELDELDALNEMENNRLCHASVSAKTNAT